MAAGSGTLTVPLFYTSSLTGAGLLLLHAFLKALPVGEGPCRHSHLQADRRTADW